MAMSYRDVPIESTDVYPKGPDGDRIMHWEPIPQSEVLTIGSDKGMTWGRFHELTHTQLGRSRRKNSIRIN
jgi:hypothetical protein